MTTTADTGLMPAEAAYAHLASFQRFDAVDVGGRRFFMPGIVTTTQQHDFADINRVYLIVTTSRGLDVRVTVGELASGHRTITSRKA
jgi:hypothetical protein